MCEITTMTVAAMAMTASAGVQVYSAVQQGREAKAAGNFNAREAENNATRLRNQGTQEENALRRRNAELVSRQRARQGAANININSGSALQVQEDAKLFGEIDALRLRDNFAREADAMDRGASLTRTQGNAAASAANIGAFSTVLSTAGTVAGKWYTPKSAAMQNGTDFGGGDYVGDIYANSRGYV